MGRSPPNRSSSIGSGGLSLLALEGDLAIRSTARQEGKPCLVAIQVQRDFHLPLKGGGRRVPTGPACIVVAIHGLLHEG